MSEKKARLACIGCGNFSTQVIYPNIPHTPEIDLMAVCDVQLDRAERAARQFGARRAYDAPEEMLDKEEIDGVFVIGPAPMHYEVAPLVLDRGLPVYVEKPSANTAAQARELAQLAESKGAWGQVGFMKRFAHVYLMAKDIVGRPEFGTLRLLRCQFAQGPYPALWGIEPGIRAFLVGQLVHLFDLIRFFGGDVSTVAALMHRASDTQVAYVVNLRFESGAVGQLDLNSLSHKQAFRDIEESLDLVGLEQNVRIDAMRELTWLGPDDFTRAAAGTGRYVQKFEPAWPTFRSPQAYGYAGEVSHFAKRCLAEAQGGPDLWDSVEALRLSEAVWESATHDGREVALGPDPERSA